MRQSTLVVEVLAQVRGEPWNDLTRALVSALRPSQVEVIEHNAAETTNAMPWRVRVYLRENKMIDRVQQECLVELPDGCNNGYDLAQLLRAAGLYQR
jgi:hypothetical protein